MKQCCLCGKSGHESRDCKWSLPLAQMHWQTSGLKPLDNVGYGKSRCLCCGDIHTVNLPCPHMRVE